MIEIWGKPQCPFCDQAKALCERQQLKYTYKQLGTDFNREDVLEQFPGARTFPQIKIHGHEKPYRILPNAWAGGSNFRIIYPR